MTTTKRDENVIQVLDPVMRGGGQPSSIDPKTGLDPLHPSWATETHRYVDDSETHADLTDLVSYEGTDVNGAPLAKIKGVSKTMRIGDLRQQLDRLEALAATPHLRADERSGDDATRAFAAGLIDEKPDAPDESATRADPDEVARQAATRARAADATSAPTSKSASKK